MRNLTMLTDLYELTMMQGYLRHGMQDEIAVFDHFFRKSDGSSQYVLIAGLEQLVEYINNLHFDEADIEYLRSLGQFDEAFLAYLKNFRFTGDIYAMAEGTVAFPNEPIVRVTAPIIEAQLVETALLNIVNHQTLIATKASRVVYAAQGGGVLEFGLRRAQGPDAGIYGARAAMIGGCVATSNVLAAQLFDVPPAGTHAHSWVMSFDSELEAFRAYADTFPDNCLLLVDTYDTLLSGVPNAIRVFEELNQRGHRPVGIRLDSGDFAYLSKQARKMLDEAGFEDARIFASGDLDETLIRDLRAQGSRIDVWGVGTKLITSEDNPSLGGVYKLGALGRAGDLRPKIKVSDNTEKTTTPGVKKVFRFYSESSGRALADLITLEHESIDCGKPLTIFHPVDTWKKTTLRNFTAKELLIPVFKGGKQVYQCPDIMSIQRYAQAELDTFWDEYKRFINPHLYKVDLSEELYTLKQTLLKQIAHG